MQVNKQFNDNTMFLIEKMKFIREYKELTQEELGKRLGVTRMEISSLESLSRNPSLNKFTTWANSLGYMVTLKRKSDIK